MKKLDRYIIGKYLRSFFYTAMLFTLISLVIDFAEKAEKLLSAEAGWDQIIFDYYLNFIPYINGLLWPLFALIAVIFFTSRLAKDSEFLAMLNAGMSFRRILRPYLLASLLIAGMSYWGGHYVIPDAAKVKFDFENTHIFKSNDKGQTRDVHFMVDSNQKVFVRYYRKTDSTARDVRIETFEQGQLVEVIKTKTMEWVQPPHEWKLKNFVRHSYRGGQESLVNGKDSSMRIDIQLYPGDFVEFVNDKEQMTSRELKDYIAKQKAKGRSNLDIYEVELYRRTADAVTIIILTIIGMAVASRKTRGGMGLHLAIGIGLGAAFVFLSRFSAAFATSQGIPPMLGVWIPNAVFFCVALYLMTRAQQ